MTHSALPVQEYERLFVGVLDTRIRCLDEKQLRALLQYEREHADRPAIMSVFERRLEQLRRASAVPGTGDPCAETSA